MLKKRIAILLAMLLTSFISHVGKYFHYIWASETSRTLNQLIGILFLLSACVSPSYRVTSKTAPDWVNELRKGDSTLRIETGGGFLYRSNIKGQKNKTPNDICQDAVNKNIEFIKKSYPFVKNIPMTIQLVFFDPELKDCSTTISVPKGIIHKMDELNELNKAYLNRIDSLNLEREDLNKKYEKMKSEQKNLTTKNLELKNELMKMKKFLNLNEKLKEEVTLTKARVEKIKEKILSRMKNDRNKIQMLDRLVERFIYNGMTFKEVSKIISVFAKEHNIYWGGYDTIRGCYSIVGKNAVKNTITHGAHEICFKPNEVGRNVVVARCDYKKRNCFSRNVGEKKWKKVKGFLGSK